MQLSIVPTAFGCAEVPVLDPDAELALRTLREHVGLVVRNASTRAHVLGRAVNSTYADALASTGATSQAMWRRFVGAVSDLTFELDRCRPAPTFASILARRALDRIVLENVDLLA